MRAIDLRQDCGACQAHGKAFATPIADALDLLQTTDSQQIQRLLSSVDPTLPADLAQAVVSASGQDYINFVRSHHHADSLKNSLLTASSKALSGIVQDDIAQFKIRSGDPNIQKCRKLLRKVFLYEGFRDGRKMSVSNGVITWGKEWESDWDAFRFLRALDIQVCPYCNADTVYAVELKRRKSGVRYKLARSALDHFYCRAVFPYLALSLYNLVPSCTRCNSSLKGKKVMRPGKCAHPYSESVDDYLRFWVDPVEIESISADAPRGSFTMTLRRRDGVDNRKAKRAEYNLNQTFHTADIYNDLFFREGGAVIYHAKNSTADMQSLLQATCPGIDPDAFLYGYALTSSSINHHRLSKMTIDLVDCVRACQRLGSRHISAVHHRDSV